MAIEDQAVDELLGGSQKPSGASVESASVDELFGNRPHVARLQDLNIRNYDVLQKKRVGDAGYAPFSTMVAASSVDDPATKLKIYAKSLFPNLPIEEAARRVGVVEDAVVYLGDDGQMYRADNPDFYARMASDVAGHAEPIALGAALGTAAGGGPIGTIAGAFYGAAGGEGFRKLRARMMYDEPQTWEENIRKMGNEGVINAALTLPGLLLGKWYTRGQAKDIGNIDDAASEQLKEDASRWGIQLTPAEITDLPSLKAQQKMAGKSPSSADVVDPFMKRRKEQIRKGVYSLLDVLSPEDSPEIAGRDLINLSNETLQATRDAAMAPAKPYYNRAYGEFKGISPDMLAEAQDLMRRPAINQAAMQAVRNAKNQGVDLGDPRMSLRGMHSMKTILDQRLVALKKDAVASAKKEEIAALQTARDALVDFIERASPTDEQGRSLYGTAREIAGRNMAAADRTLNGALRVTGGMSETNAINAPRKLLDAANFGPNAVKTAVDALRKQSPEQADAAVRAFLQDQFDTASREYISQTGQATAGARFWTRMLGNPRQSAVLKAAMTPEQWDAFQSLGRVLEATGRVPMSGSDTAWNQEALRIAKDAGGSKMVALLRGFSPLDIANKVADWTQQKLTDNYAQKVAKIITSPEGMKQLKELRRLPVDSQARLVKTALLLDVPLRVYVRSQQPPQGSPPEALADRQQ